MQDRDVTADRNFVEYLLMSDGRRTIRIDAVAALDSNRQPDAVYEFLNCGGYEDAVEWAANDFEQDHDFIEMVLKAYTASLSPEVNRQATKVKKERPYQKRQFIESGLAAAKERDRIDRAATARPVDEPARDYVRQVAATDPGERARAAADWALRGGATDADVQEFFASGWIFGAYQDLTGYRTRTADTDKNWRSTLRGLLTTAEAADAVHAPQAWKAVEDQATAALDGWAPLRQTAATQADHWQRVVAGAKTGTSWAVVAQPGARVRQEWAKQVAFTQQEIDYLEDVRARARSANGATR
ncbi:hypothetical protein D5S17_09665 [Pseudonocardiaceae bacterium YIM PH 21723]|nr:hypothetical protein D5S17_09665 [Pseudonocardiaceae bacterium YIM PH 21723]